MAAGLLLCVQWFGCGEETDVRGVLQPSLIEKKETAKIRFEVPYPYADQVYVREPNLPDGLEYLTGPFIRPLRLEGISVIEYTVRGSRSGRYVIPPFRIRIPYRTLETKKMAFFVGEDVNGKLEVPITLSWEVPEGKMYEGQAVPVTLWADMVRAIPETPQITLGVNEDVIVRGISQSAMSRTIPVHNMELIRAPLQTFMFHFTESGEITVSAKAFRINGVSGRVPALTLKVLPVPDNGGNPRFLGVGNANFLINIETEKIEGFQLISITMEYNGMGNLPFFQFPNVETEHCEYVRSSESEEYEPLENSLFGYRGYRRKTVTVRQKPYVEGRIIIPEVRIFNPLSAEILTYPKKEMSIEKVADRATVDVDGGQSPPGIPHPEEMGKLPISRLHEKRWIYLLLVPGVLAVFFNFSLSKIKHYGILCIVFLFIGCVPIIKNSREEKQLSGRDMYREGYTLAMNGDYGKALYVLRILQRERPMDFRLINSIRALESHAGVKRQIPVRWRIHPDLFLAAVFCSLYGSVFISFICKREKKKWLIIPALFFIGSIVGLGLTLRSPSVGVLKKDTALLVVPAADGSVKSTLKEGTTVKIQGEWKEYHQVSTGDAIIGWVDTSNMWLEE